MRNIALPITLAALLVSGAAQAQGPGGQTSGQQQQQATPEQRFQEMDTNKDGKVTKQEFLSMMDARWARIIEHTDTSKDGVISKEEFMAAPKAPRSGGQQPQR